MKEITYSCENRVMLLTIQKLVMKLGKLSRKTKKQKQFQQIWMKFAFSFYILLAFLLIAIELMLAVSIYCYLIKHQAKQKHLLPFHVTNNDLREVLY